jgi:peptidoglycan/xylan/chitin deacetylase (PgdA/CDA1 family)
VSGTLIKVAAGVAAGTAIGVGLSFYQPAWLIGAISRLWGDVVWIGRSDIPQVALTFDDGPDPQYTPTVLETLRAHGAQATFFLIGRNAVEHPDLVERIRREGHQIANHMWRDQNALLMSDEAAEQSLIETERVLELKAPKWLRPAGGFGRPSFLRRARKLGYRVVIGSAYASDPRKLPAGYIVWALTRMMRPGVIMVLHDSGGDRRRSVVAVDPILRYGQSHGLRFVTLNQLFSLE